MGFTFFKIALSACIIAFTSWLSGKRPDLAGFIIALPIATLLVLPFSYAEYSDPDTSIKFARSIAAAIPLSLTFFIPFILANKLPFGFWGIYVMGMACLVLSFFIHRWLTSFL